MVPEYSSSSLKFGHFLVLEISAVRGAQHLGKEEAPMRENVAVR
jgi:hypothetical protein